MTIPSWIIRALLISTGLLIVPFTASFLFDGWLWSFFDYVFAWFLFSFASLAISFAINSSKTTAYKVATALAVMTTFLLIWINAAVGLIGDEDLDGPNSLYFGVLAVGFIGTFLARLNPRGMARALFATAFAELLVPMLALFIWPPSTISWLPGVMQVFILNSVFAISFIISALLFHQATDGANPK